MDAAAASASNGGNGAPSTRFSGDRDGAFPAAFGLAVITGLADELQVSSTEPGLSVRMSWPATPASS